MDVKCEQCSAEYDFDESLLGEKGTTVKCSSCGHVFRVQPPRKDISRPLKLRLSRTGAVEPLASLRDLQQRIHAGTVTPDDQLGRDGFPWRRLADVPELKNFFAQRTGAASSSMRSAEGTPNHKQLRVSPGSMPPPNDPSSPASRPQGGRTVLGVGPENPQIPPPPRVPNFGGQQPQASAARGNGAPEHQSGVPDRLRGHPSPEPQGKAPTSNAPTAPRLRPDSASMSQAPTVPGLVPTDMRTSRAPGGPELQSGVPDRLRGHAAPQGAAGPSNPVRLYLSEDERPPERATAGSSKIWVYAAVLLLLGGGVWFGISAMSSRSATQAVAAEQRVETPPPAPAVAPTEPTPSPAPTEPAANPGKPGEVAHAAPPAEKPATEQPAAAPAEATAKPDEHHASSGSHEHSGDSKAEPKDYSGWVTQGDKAFSKGDLPTARKAYEAALAMRGTGSEANTGMGFTLLGEGQASQAIPYFDRASSNGYAEAYIGMGDAYRRLGQKSEAVEAYKDYLERLPGGSRATYVRHQLDNMGGGASDKPAADKPAASDKPAPTGENPPSNDYVPAGEEKGTP